MHMPALLGLSKRVVEQGRVGAVETALYGEARAREEAVRRAAAAERAAKREAERARVQRARQWGDEEVRLLEKALDKFPQARRPAAVHLGHARSLQSCWLLRCKHLNAQPVVLPTRCGAGGFQCQ